MPTRNIGLTEHFSRFVDEQVEEGRYRDASEVMLAGLRLLEERTNHEQEKLPLLRNLAAEGFAQLDQGQGIAINGEAELATYIGAIGRRCV